MSLLFKDRVDAGKQLAAALISYKGQDVVAYALPRGGVVLGAEVARTLNIPLDLIVVRKVGHPQSPEYAIAAVAEDGDIVLNQFTANAIDKAWFDESVRIEREEARRRRELYACGRDPIPAASKTAIIIDDGLATGLSMCAAVQEVRHCHPAKIVVAVPVAEPTIVQHLKGIVDDVIALCVTADFGSVGSFYFDFPQVSDEEVIDLLMSLR